MAYVSLQWNQILCRPHTLFGEINSIRQFIMEEPHATVVRKFTEWAGEGSAFVECNAADSIAGFELQDPFGQ